MSRGTPHRAVRVPDDVWAAALAATAANDTTVTAVIVDALTRYARRHPAPTTTRKATR